MAQGRFLQEYQKNAVNGASPLQLVIMLYDGALRFFETSKAMMLQKDIDKQNHYFKKAQAIVMELMSCLDMDKGGDVSTNLLSLYNYILQQSVEANLTDDPVKVDECIRILSELRGSWVEIERSQGKNYHESRTAA